jgi:hypothetical protein
LKARVASLERERDNLLAAKASIEDSVSPLKRMTRSVNSPLFLMFSCNGRSKNWKPSANTRCGRKKTLKPILKTLRSESSEPKRQHRKVLPVLPLQQQDLAKCAVVPTISTNVLPAMDWTEMIPKLPLAPSKTAIPLYSASQPMFFR